MDFGKLVEKLNAIRDETPVIDQDASPAVALMKKKTKEAMKAPKKSEKK